MTMITYILILLATFASCGGSTSNTTLQLPITINPLLQDAIQRDFFTDALIQSDATFYEHVTFNDLVKELGFNSRVPQLKKHLMSLVVLGLAAMENGLTVDQFEFLNQSKWTIIMSVEELADVSNNLTLPLHDEVPLITIQEAMFKILEKRFNFKTEEIAERLNTTKDEIYAFLEPGWIQVVNFITEKTILALSRNYTIPPFYIAEALNMSLSKLYNSTLPQLEDILVNKIDVIREAAKRWKRILSSSIAGLLRVSSTAFSTVVSTMLPINSTVPVILKKTTTMAIQPSFITQTETKTSSILNEISSQQEMSYTSSKAFTAMLESSPTIVLQSGSMPNMTSMNSPIMGIQTTIFSFTNVESSSVPEMQKSTLILTKTQSITSMYHTPDSMTTSQQSKRSSTLQTDMISQSVINQVSTTQQHSSMFQPTTTEFVLPTRTEMIPTITSKPSTTSSNIAEMFTSMSSPGLSQETSSKMMETSSKMTKISSTPHMMDTSSSQQMTTTKILPTSTTVPKFAYVSTSNDLTKSMVNTTPTPSLDKAISSYDTTAYDMSETMSVDAMKSSSMAEITSIITTSFVTTSSYGKISKETPKTPTSSYGKISSQTPKLPTSSYGKLSTETPKLPTSSQLTKTTQHFAESTTSSLFLRNPQTPSSQAHSSHSVLTTPATTREFSTSSRYQQSTNILERSPGFTSTADGLISKTIIPVQPSSYHATSSSSHVKVAGRPSVTYTQSMSITVTTTPTTPKVGNTPNARSEDDIDPVVLIVIPIMCVLFLAAIVVAFVMWIRHKRRRKSAEQNNAERGSELSRQGLVESLENINNNTTTGLVNRGGDDRSSRSMSRTSSMSNLETIHEGGEPEEPEVYKLDEII